MPFGSKMYKECSYCIHCENKLVVLTIQWLPCLQTNWRDSGYKTFAMVCKSN